MTTYLLPTLRQEQYHRTKCLQAQLYIHPLKEPTERHTLTQVTQITVDFVPILVTWKNSTHAHKYMYMITPSGWNASPSQAALFFTIF